MLIWNKVNPSIDSYFTNTLDGPRKDNILKAEQNEITDNNGVLENYELSDVKGATITKNGNNLTITATEVGNMSFKLVKLGNRYGEPVRLYYSSDSQNVIRRGNIDPIMINNSIKVYGGKVSIQKTDADTYEFIPQGEATLGGAKYGIYKEEEVLVEKNSRGKISWKDTIKKSNVIVSKDNLIFLPLYSKKKNTKDAFISQCMVYVINHTLKNFPYFIELPPVRGKECKIDFLANKDYTLRQLYQYRNTIFKDYQKELLEALISFFEKYNKNPNGGAIHIKINYFDMIWEKMVNKYLNDCFVKVDKENRKLEFKYERIKRANHFNSKKFNIDRSEHKFSIKPDHYCEEEDNMYVFDSKYYDEISDLNYKQFSYTILLGNSQLGNNKNLYSALLLPGKNRGKLHLKLDIPYCQLNQGCNYIIEQFLDVKLLMKNYLNMNIEKELKEQKN